MGKFCTQCGRPLEDNEICNCTQTSTPIQPAPQQPKTPSQTSLEIKNSFSNLLTAVKTIFKDPTASCHALSKSENWLMAIILVAVQALFSGFFTLIAASFSIRYVSFAATDLVIVFFFTFLSSVAISAAMMGLILAFGKIYKTSVTLQSSLAIVGIRSFFTLPFTVLAMIFCFMNLGAGIILFSIGEIFALLMIFMAIQISFKTSANKAFAIASLTAVILLILFGILFAIYVSVNGENLIGGGFTSTIEDNLEDILDGLGDYY